MLCIKKSALILSAFLLSFFITNFARAMPVGTLLYRTSSNGNLYGYNTNELVVVKNKMIKNIYTGHVAIYVGKENGVDYIVEAMPDGIIKVPAKHFLNSKNGEKIIGAKIPKGLTETQRIKISELAKKMADSNLDYDFDFKKQKGPSSGEWICVGVTEKIYESANIQNPLDLSQLQYDPRFYAINITADGFDNYSVFNKENGDCLSKSLEFSKIEANNQTIIPFPEVFGFNAGKEYDNERYFFFPITQYWQDILENAKIDIRLESDFIDNDIRGKTPELLMIFKWSLINNTSSGLNNILDKIVSIFSKNKKELVDLDNDLNNIIEGNNNNNEDNESSFNNNLIFGFSTSSISSVSNENKIILGKTNSSINISGGSNTSGLAVSSTSNNLENNLNISSVGNINDSDNNFNETENLNNFISENLNLEMAKKIVISRIYATLTDDYIELYNPTDKDINLEEVGARIYKTKTSATPSLMMRIGNLNDGSYPGGVIIASKQKYLIARSSANTSIKNRAQAIAAKNDFSFTGNSYTIYLSIGVVSSDNDEDIIDKVGFGLSAKYFEKNPASEILDNHILVRRAKNNSTALSMKDGGPDFLLGNPYDSNDNSFDFVLVSLLENNENNNNENNNNENNNQNNTNNNQNNDQNNNQSNQNNENNNQENNSNNNENSNPQLFPLLISRVYATLNDDYIELYNPNNSIINLEEAGIRLYKTKTSATPSLMMRVGNLSDGSYPGGVNVGPYGKYLITRSSASEQIKSIAQAISSRSEFTFTGDGYTVYLGKSTISGDNDEDVIDKVGFGGATYYYNLPSLEILDNHVLTRKAKEDSTAIDMSIFGNHFSLGNSFDSKNNNFDFVLVDLSYSGEQNNGENNGENNNQETEENNENENDENEDNENDDNNDENDGENNNNEENVDEEIEENIEDQENFYNYCINPGLYLDNIIHLWHLDECSGDATFDSISGKDSFNNSIWQEGKFGCGLRQYFSHSSLHTKLNPSFDSNNFTLSFYYKNLFSNSRPLFKFSNSVSSDFFMVKLYPYYTDFYNIPGVSSRDSNLKWINDDSWHLFSFVVNKTQNYWAFYKDGVEVYRINMGSKLFIEADGFSIKGDNNYNLMDEMIIFNRALNPEEIAQIYNFNLPLNSNTCSLPTISNPELINYWNFDEESGEYCYDSVGFSNFVINPVSRIISDNGNNFIKISPDSSNVFAQFSNPFYHKSLSMSLWIKSENALSEGESQINLLSNNKKLLGLSVSNNDFYYNFNDYNFKVNDYINELALLDGNWHNIVLSYNSYYLKLNLYIDGVIVKSWDKNWLNNILIDKIILKSIGFNYFLDEIGVWKGAFDSNIVDFIYNNQKNFFID